MAFHFSLESVLRLRLSLEEMEKQRLGAIQKELVKISERVQAATNLLKIERQKKANELQAGIKSAELNFHGLCHEQLRTFLQRLQAEREQVLQRHQKQQEQYLAARRERQAVERLKEKAQQQYQVELKRKEQSAADELFLMRQRICHNHQKVPADGSG